MSDVWVMISPPPDPRWVRDSMGSDKQTVWKHIMGRHHVQTPVHAKFSNSLSTGHRVCDLERRQGTASSPSCIKVSNLPSSLLPTEIVYKNYKEAEPTSSQISSGSQMLCRTTDKRRSQAAIWTTDNEFCNLDTEFEMGNRLIDCPRSLSPSTRPTINGDQFAASTCLQAYDKRSYEILSQTASYHQDKENLDLRVDTDHQLAFVNIQQQARSMKNKADNINKPTLHCNVLGKRNYECIAPDNVSKFNEQFVNHDASIQLPDGSSLVFAKRLAKLHKQSLMPSSWIKKIIADKVVDKVNSSNKSSMNDAMKLLSRNSEKATQKGLEFTEKLQSVDMVTPEERRLVANRLMQSEKLAITLVYSDGSTQLRDIPQQKGKFRSLEPVVIALAVAYSEDTKVSFGDIFTNVFQAHLKIPFVAHGHVLYDWIKQLIDQMMCSKSHRLCFESQELIQAIILHFKFEEHRVSSRWSLFDPKIAAWLLDPDHPPVTFLQTCKVFLDHPDSHQEVGLANSCAVCADLDQLYAISESMHSRLQECGLWNLFVNVEVPLTCSLALLELRGLCIDMNTMKKSGYMLQERLASLEVKAHKSAGREFVINSHSQLRKVLFDELKLDKLLPRQQKIARTVTGNQMSTSESVLKQLTHLHSLPALVLDYRQTQKLKSTYVEGIVSFVKEGLLTSHWDQTAAATGRITSTSPNIQAVPRLPITLAALSCDFDNSIQTKLNIGRQTDTIFYAREPFISKPGCVFLSADFQHIELRMLAHLSKDPALIEMFRCQQSEDVFKELTAHWLRKSLSDVSQRERERTKRVVYSIIYGAGKGKLAEILDTSTEEANDVLQSFLATFPGVKSYTRNCIEETQEAGLNVTLFKRRRLFPNINHSNFLLKSYAERQAVNFCVQGSAADVCKAAMIRIDQKLASNPDLQTRLLIQIHDELLYQVPKPELPEVSVLVRRIMESADTLLDCADVVPLRVPLRVALSVGTNWAHMTQLGHDSPTITV